MNRRYVLPVLLAVCVCLGVLMGNITARYAVRTQSARNETRRFENLLNHQGEENKLSDLMRMIESRYVDDVDMDSIVEKIMPEIIAELDPHSSYIPKSDLQEVNDDLNGSFSGIGVQFNIQRDTVMVVAVISGGPSERVGLVAGDRIVRVDGEDFTGKDISNEVVMKRLRGERGSHVNLGIVRYGASKELTFDVERGDVPVTSVDVAYEIEKGVGYIRVNKFGANTYTEFLTSLTNLLRQGCVRFIIDLRGNPGGYMDAATSMLNEFLPKGTLMVYTEGRTLRRENVVASGGGIGQNVKVVVLIDEWSASASEIFAGAIQDNDRGVVVGRRSFGKGLVQNQFEFEDSSAVRLTVARYYTPSGRCIQKPYQRGDSEAYEEEIFERYEHGEPFHADSVKQVDSTVYRTKKGRIVYGGGGIMPDVYVPRDTSNYTAYYRELINRGLIYQFAFKYADEHRADFKKFKEVKDLQQYLKTQGLLQQLVGYAQEQGLKRNDAQIRQSEAAIGNLLEANICRDILWNEAFYMIVNERDEMVRRAIEVAKED